MPEHTSWFTYLMALPAFRNLEHTLDQKAFAYPAGTPHTLEFTTLAIFVILVIMLFVMITRARIVKTEQAIVPEGKLTVASFMENFAEIFYGMLKNLMGPEDAKYFLPLIGTCAVFIFFSNAIALIPGFAAPTSNFNMTVACGLIIFLATHYYGLRRGGIGYLKHFVGPFIWLAPLMLPIELISHCIRPMTLGIRLAMNMTVDHLLVGVFTGLIPLLVPVAIMLLGVLVVVVQTYVFCLLSGIYISLAIEHHEDHDVGDHAEDPHHGHGLPQDAPLP